MARWKAKPDEQIGTVVAELLGRNFRWVLFEKFNGRQIAAKTGETWVSLQLRFKGLHRKRNAGVRKKNYHLAWNIEQQRFQRNRFVFQLTKSDPDIYAWVEGVCRSKLSGNAATPESVDRENVLGHNPRAVRKNISVDEVVALRALGLKQADIAARLQCNQSLISRLLKAQGDPRDLRTRSGLELSTDEQRSEATAAA